MPAQSYSQYFKIDEKYHSVVTRDLIEKGEVRWDRFYPHETFIHLLRQTVDMLSGKESKSIWVEGTYGTGKSHAALALKCLLEASDSEVRRYFTDFGLNMDLCNKFLAARSESINGKLILIHRIGSAQIKSDDDLVWAVQNSVAEALSKAGITNQAAGTMKDALIDWVNEKPANKAYLDALLKEAPFEFGGRNVEQLVEELSSDNETSIEYLMNKLAALCRANGILGMNMDAERLAQWLHQVIAVNHLGAIVFIWDEFSEYFKNCRNALTGFQTLIEVSQSSPLYFIIVTHESDGLITNTSDRSKIGNRFIEPRVLIELPDNMAFRLMRKAMKETDDPVMKGEWDKVKQGLNNRLTSVRNTITTGAKKHAKAGPKTLLSDEDLQEIVPLHPYAALILKHISRVFTASQRSMFDFITARDPDEGDEEKTGSGDQNSEKVLVCRAFKWFINHHSARGSENLMTVDLLWDFFNVKAGGNMNPDALEILNNFDILTSEFRLSPDQQRVLKTVLLMNAICTRVQEADMLVPTYENIDLAFLGTGWAPGKAKSIAMALVHRDPPLQPVLFEVPLENGSMRVIPKATGGIDIGAIKDRIRSQLSTQILVQDGEFGKDIKIPANLVGHFTMSMVYVNSKSAQIFNNAIRDAKKRAENDPDHFQLCTILAMTDEERSEAGRQIQNILVSGIPENLLLLDATTNTFTPYLENYITNRAYSEYYLKGDGDQSRQFAAYAVRNLESWREQVKNGQFRLYDHKHPNGQMRVDFSAMSDLLQEINLTKFPFGIEQYNVNPTMFTRMSMGQGAECGLSETEKGSFTSSNVKNRLSTALSGAWKTPGEYWEDPTKQGLVIVKVKQKVEGVIAAGFQKNGRIDIIDIFEELRRAPYGFTASNLTAFVLGFVLKEYANEQYFWSNGTTRPMSPELMKGAIKNALDQSVTPKANYRPEAIVRMSGEVRRFLTGTAVIFHDSLDRCGSVDAAASIIRQGMKRLEFPIWCVKSILDRVDVQTDAGVIAEVIDQYMGIANIKNYDRDTTESDLATNIGTAMEKNPSLISDLEKLLVSQKCREGMKAYLDSYCAGKLTELAAAIKDNGTYVSEVKKKCNAEEANWVWSADTVNAKIDEVIVEYGIIAESNTMIAPAASYLGCMRNWRDRIQNFRISFEAMENEAGDLRELLDLLCDMKKNGGMIPESKKERFLELLKEKKDDFHSLYIHQIDMFRKIAASWLTELEDGDVDELFTAYMDTGVFTDAANKYFKSIEEKVSAFLKAKVKARLEQLWREKTDTLSPRDWSRHYETPVLCMFDDNERLTAKEVFDVFLKQNPNQAEADKAMTYLWNGTFYDRLASQAERDRCMRERVVGDYVYILTDIDEVRTYLRSYASMVHPYDWMDNSIIRNKIEQMADKRYKIDGAAEAQEAIDELTLDDVRTYLKDLIKTDMKVGIAILKKKPR